MSPELSGGFLFSPIGPYALKSGGLLESHRVDRECNLPGRERDHTDLQRKANLVQEKSGGQRD